MGTLNVGSMTGKRKELENMMKGRKVDILCVAETNWKGSKVWNIRDGIKFMYIYYQGVDGKRNEVGVIMKKECMQTY